MYNGAAFLIFKVKCNWLQLFLKILLVKCFKFVYSDLTFIFSKVLKVNCKNVCIKIFQFLCFKPSFLLIMISKNLDDENLIQQRVRTQSQFPHLWFKSQVMHYTPKGPPQLTPKISRTPLPLPTNKNSRKSNITDDVNWGGL